MKKKTIAKISCAAAFMLMGTVHESTAQCNTFLMEGNPTQCCDTFHIDNNGDTICDSWYYVGLKDASANMDFNNGSVQSTNDGITNVYGERGTNTGGGLGDSANMQAAEFGWKPFTDTEFSRWRFNGYTNWTSPTALFKAQYTGTNSEVIALKAFSKYGTGKGVGAYIEGGSKGLNIINSGGNATKATYGVIATSTASSTSTSSAIKRYGGYFTASGGTNGTIEGIYANATGGAAATRYAGYFGNNVYVNGSVTALVPLIIGSDRKLKENIAEENNALEKILQLKPSSYYFKKELVGKMNMATSLQHGLIAQDVEKIFPELVTEVTQPANFDPVTEKEISEEITFKGINYMGFIPLLIESVKEQQELITTLQSENYLLKNELAAINKKLEQQMKTEVKNSSFLQQNKPNPFTEATEINYSISPGAGSASLKIYSMESKIMKSYSLDISQSGKLIIPATTFAAGTYTYELIVDGLKVDSKNMIVLKQ